MGVRGRVALVALGACIGCKKAPAVRLTYQVDTAHPYRAGNDPAKTMATTRQVIATRLNQMKVPATATTADDGVIVELPVMSPDDLRAVKGTLSEGGRLEFEAVDDSGTAAVFGSLKESAYPPDEGIAAYAEMVPDGLDASGTKKQVKALYARVTCQPPKYDSETSSECLGRLQAWASHLDVPHDHAMSFEAVAEPVPDAGAHRTSQVGWRTVYLATPAALTGDSLIEMRVGQGQEDLGQYYIALTFDPAGAKLLEDLTRANLNRRLAVVLDDVVESAPVIRSPIAGGKAQITLSLGDPEKQLHDAQHLELLLRSGALPAPLHLVNEAAFPASR
jgi:preprotein translocase subunit SecD